VDAVKREEMAVTSAIGMLIAAVLIVGIVFGYKACDSADARIERCMNSGRSGADCRQAFGFGGNR